MDVSHVTSNMRETHICKPINTYGSIFTGSRTPDLLQGTIKGWAQGPPAFRDPFSPHLESGLQSSWFTPAEHLLKALPSALLLFEGSGPYSCHPTWSPLQAHLPHRSWLHTRGAGQDQGGVPLERSSGTQ